MYGVEFYHGNDGAAISSSEPYEASEIVDDLDEEVAEEFREAFASYPNGLEGTLATLIVMISVPDMDEVSMVYNGYQIFMTR